MARLSPPASSRGTSVSRPRRCASTTPRGSCRSLIGMRGCRRLRDLAALHRVFGEDSEWRELWEESGQLEEARGALAPVLEALERLR